MSLRKESKREKQKAERRAEASALTPTLSLDEPVTEVMASTKPEIDRQGAGDGGDISERIVPPMKKVKKVKKKKTR